MEPSRHEPGLLEVDDVQSERARADELGRTAEHEPQEELPRSSPREQPAKAVHIDPDQYTGGGHE